MTQLKIVAQSEAKTDKTRLDRWINQTNAFGSISDPISKTSFYRESNLDRFILETMYRHEWVTRRAVDIPAQDSTREWITLTHDNPNRLQVAVDEIERLNLRGQFEEAIILARLYGGNVLIMGAFDGNPPDEPLTVPKRPTLFMANVDRYLAYPQTFYRDPLDPNFGEVETYLVNRPHVQGSDVQRVHETRVIRFDGNYLPPIERIRNFTYGASIVENIFEAVRQFGVSNQSGSSVLQDFITKKLKIANLKDLIDNDDGESMLLKRLGIMAAEIATNNLAIYGEDEELDKMGTPINGLPELINIFIDIVSAAAGIPKARFFNNESGRLGGNAGENDLRNHYDNIAAFQKNRLSSKVRRALDVILAPLGFEPGEVGFEWNPLWQMSEKEMAETRLAVAQADEIYIRSGVVEPEEVALTRFAGEGINLNDMNIATKPREDFFDQLEKGEIETGQNIPDLSEEEDDDVNIPASEETEPTEQDEDTDES